MKLLRDCSLSETPLVARSVLYLNPNLLSFTKGRHANLMLQPCRQSSARRPVNWLMSVPLIVSEALMMEFSLNQAMESFISDWYVSIFWMVELISGASFS